MLTVAHSMQKHLCALKVCDGISETTNLAMSVFSCAGGFMELLGVTTKHHKNNKVEIQL